MKVDSFDEPIFVADIDELIYALISFNCCGLILLYTSGAIFWVIVMHRTYSSVSSLVFSLAPRNALPVEASHFEIAIRECSNCKVIPFSLMNSLLTSSNNSDSGIVTEITISLSNSQANQKPLMTTTLKGFWFAICQTAKIAITASGKGNAGSVAAAP